ncbi:urease accessory protein UreG [Rhizoclosmatium globosum]|uniref:Urease accessory protein UreG n=1 Tax=Rhizoclosmatium globosum TaxID=329046 RepID=A0A1Y2APN6_9FUNG|nr:urease accessory protein UreG [Rhizoclosmatium globosum]|eukprot:ORY23905.1 urease accessory protein UreG [Rhizoclosmatium globosum]
MHSHDGVNFHGSHAAPQPAPGQHSHDGINFHGSHDQQPQQPQMTQQQMQMLMRMMQQQQLAQQQQQEQQQQGHGHGLHSHDGVNFHGSHSEPAPGQHSHDGINFHGSHDEPSHGGHGGHGHAHEEPKDEPGTYETRVLPYTAEEGRSFASKGFSIGIAGPVGCGKTTLVAALCKALRTQYSLSVIINDLYTTLDAQSLIDDGVLEKERVKGLTTGIWSRVAIDEDVEDNFTVGEAISQKYSCNIVIFEAAGDNLGANFDRNLSDFTIFIIDTAAGAQCPLKGGKGVTQADLLVINKTDLAPHCGVSLKVLESNAKKMRGEGPIVLASLKKGDGVDAIVDAIKKQYEESGAKEFFDAKK